MANTITNTFITGAVSTTQQTALGNFNTAMAALTTYPGSTPVVILSSGQEVTWDGTALNYTFWAFVQYYSA
jgi:hypothetical protein